MFPSSTYSATSYGDLLPPVSTTATISAAASAYGFLDVNGSSPPLPIPLPVFGSSPPYSSSWPSNYLNRSSSTRSLPLHQYIPEALSSLPFSSSSPQHHHIQQPVPVFSSSPPSTSRDFLDFNARPVRRVFSTGDLQRENSHHASSGESYGREGGSGGVLAGRVGRYSAEERKERIERYRSKRNQRNFHKKITYACRKTLADSRPRVRGRFARNGETETETEVEMEAEPAASNNSMFDNYDYSYNISYAPTHSWSGSSSSYVNGGGSDFWSQMQGVLATDKESFDYDEDLLASFADVFSMSLLS